MTRFGRSLPLMFASLALVATSAHGQTLTVTNDLTLWLKSDTLALTNNASVTFWGDSSTNQNNAVSLSGPGTPTYLTNGINGRPAVQFNGTSNFLSLTNKVDPIYGPRVRLPNGLTMIAVFQTTSADTVRSYISNPAQTIIGDNTGATYSEFGLQGGKGEYSYYVSGWNYVDGVTALNNTNIYPGHYVIATHRKSDGLVNLYSDGALQATTNLSYQITYTGISQISGGYPGTASDLYSGLIGEVLVYNRDLTPTELHSVELYLNSRWLDVPEPSTVALIASAAIGLVALRQRRQG